MQSSWHQEWAPQRPRVICMRTENSLRAHVAFNAELRGAFQAFVSGLEADCRSLVRHALDVATSAYAKPLLSLSGLSLDDSSPGGGADPHEALQNVPPAAPPTQIVPDRCSLAGLSCMLFRRMLHHTTCWEGAHTATLHMLATAHESRCKLFGKKRTRRAAWCGSCKPEEVFPERM